ncbi:MAG: TIGR00296 family protein [Candidatus Diapherotrites archaeon]|nr:TIGR00296 family protein [Candidatus Diapherotrites archaeon]
MELLSLEQGEFLVKLARNAIAVYLAKGETLKPPEHSALLDEKRGVFCTLKTTDDELRGCIGLPYPVKPLAEAVIDAAVSSATRDPRFPPVEAPELDNLIVELTVLTKPEKIEGPREELPKKVVVGKHGLIVQYGFTSGLLLPQVATENNWDSREFLDMTCWKAGLPKSCWQRDDVEVLAFEGQVFKEETPGGKVIEEKIS